MRSKERESGDTLGYFHTPRSWLWMNLKTAREIQALDCPESERVRLAWVGVGKGMTAVMVARVTGLTLEEIEGIPPFTFITKGGEIL